MLLEYKPTENIALGTTLTPGLVEVDFTTVTNYLYKEVPVVTTGVVQTIKLDVSQVLSLKSVQLDLGGCSLKTFTVTLYLIITLF